MRLHRFYITTPITSNTFDVANVDLVHQWKKVFRYNVGSQVIVFDGSGTDYLCMISSLRAMGATLTVFKKEKTADISTRKNIYLCMALIKKDNFEFVVQKATEIGVTNIIPILSERSEKRKLNMERMNKIAIEAVEQSGRGDIPVVHKPIGIQELFDTGLLPQEKIIFHPEGVSLDQYKKSTNHSSFALFIGPEGGWSDKEISLLRSYHATVVSLGDTILRAETAGIVTPALFILA